MMPKETRELAQMLLTTCEIDLIHCIRELDYGRLVIHVQAGQPVRLEEGIRSRKLGERPRDQQ